MISHKVQAIMQLTFDLYEHTADMLHNIDYSLCSLNESVLSFA